MHEQYYNYEYKQLVAVGIRLDTVDSNYNIFNMKRRNTKGICKIDVHMNICAFCLKQNKSSK